MLEAHIRIFLVADEDDAVFWDACLLRSLDSHVQLVPLSDQSLGAAVLELKRELFHVVSWIGGRDDTAGPECSPCDNWRVDAIGCVECEDIALFPFPAGFEAFAKVGGGLLDLGVCVGAVGVWVEVDHLMVG